MSVFDIARAAVRVVMKQVAKALNKISGGKITPNSVTVTGLLAHIPIAILIASGHFYWAALFLIIFGLFDTLDGELARLQKTVSNAGMFLDSATDRLKEAMLYTGAAYAIIATGRVYMAVWAVVACGASLSVSFIKSRGENAFKDTRLTPSELNRVFADGLAKFEVRMAIFIIGLLSGRVILAVIIIAVLAGLTALGRLYRIFKKLNVQA
jgi:CDP-diacylglycerol--glycerol-3-phosphate 3-phosphatidyltransferase